MRPHKFIQAAWFAILGAATDEGLGDGSSQKADESEVLPHVASQSLT